MTPRMATHLWQRTPAIDPESALRRPPMMRCQKSPTGFVQDSVIITTCGLRRIQDLRVGDRLVTRSSGVVPVDRIEQNSLVAKAVYVIAGTMGHHHATRDSLLPAGQPVLVRDWRAQALGRHPEIIACAETLIDGEFVRDLGQQPMTLYRVFCKTAQVLYADGMELVSADLMLTPSDAG